MPPLIKIMTTKKERLFHQGWEWEYIEKIHFTSNVLCLGHRYRQVKIFISPLKIQIVNKRNAWDWRRWFESYLNNDKNWSDMYEWICPERQRCGQCMWVESSLYRPVISKLSNLSQAMSITQHLKSKNNVSKREGDARRKVANYVIFGCLLKYCQVFPA